MNRRQALATFTSASATALSSSDFLRAAESAGMHIASNTYPWTTFARRAGDKLTLHTDELLSRMAGTGVHGYEPIINSPAEFEGLAERLKKHGLEMRSLYVNSTLHDEAKVEESIAAVTAIAEAALDLGTRIVVTNPSPIKWGSGEDKSDKQLIFQGKSLDRLGATLRDLGVQLAYHNHDAELRNGAREFHHMLTSTDPRNVKFCLDAHWVFRGCGDSEVAVFDALEHYHERIVELHLRQSAGGIWTEAFSPRGDIDYERLIAFLGAKNIQPHLVLKQAVEKESPTEMTATAAHQLGREQLQSIL